MLVSARNESTVNGKPGLNTWPRWVNDLFESKDPQEVSQYGTAVFKHTRNDTRKLGFVFVHGNKKAHFVMMDRELAEKLIESIKARIDELDA